MPPPIDNHELYLHIRVLIGLVLGLSLTRILSGLSRIVQHPGRVSLSATHLLWVATILVSAIHFWWWEFSLAEVRTWHFALFVFLLFYAFLWYLLASLLFPDDLAEYGSYEAYFLSRRKWFFGFFAATFVADFFDTILKGWDRLALLGPEYPFRLGTGFVLCLIGAWTSRKRFHLLFAAGYLIYDISWILRAYDMIG